MSLFVWFMKAKVYKVVMYSLFCFELPCKPLNFPPSLITHDAIKSVNSSIREHKPTSLRQILWFGQIPLRLFCLSMKILTFAVPQNKAPTLTPSLTDNLPLVLQNRTAAVRIAVVRFFTGG